MKKSSKSPQKANAAPSARRSSTGEPNISQHPDGFLVRFVRGGIERRAFVAGGQPDAFEKAVKLRNRMLAEIKKELGKQKKS